MVLHRTGGYDTWSCTIGSGMDSCIVDSRTLVTQWDDVAVEVADSCLLKGFKIIVSNDPNAGIGWVGCGRSGSKSCLVTLNKIVSASIGVLLDATFYELADIAVYNNIFENVNRGVELFNSNAIVRNNFILIPNNELYPLN